MLALFLADLHLFAQKGITDSLKHALRYEQNPRKKIDIKNKLGELNSIERIGYWDTILSESKSIKYTHGIVYSSFMQSLNYTKIGDYVKAVEYAEQSLKEAKNDKDSVWMGYSIEHLGSLNSYINEQETALSYYNEALNLYSKGIKFWRKGYVTIRIGEIAEQKNEFEKAKALYKKSLLEFSFTHDSSGMSIAYNKIGKVYHSWGNIDTALYYFIKAEEVRKNVVDEYYFCSILNDIASAYLDKKELPKALHYILFSQKEADRIGDRSVAFRDIQNLFYRYYKQKGDFKLSLKYKEIADSLTEKIKSESNDKAILKQQSKHLYEQQKEIDRLENQRILDKEIEEKHQQKLIIIAALIVLVIMLVFSVFLYKRFKLTQKQKIVIEEKEKITQYQKHLIEEKHREITDSINYAERIQRSFLATKEQLDINLKEYFVLFQPKDIVSGDFYWVHTLHNGNFVLVTADSTGHGVPGAIMSLLNTSALEKAVESGICEPAQILNHTRKTIIERLKKDGSAEGGKDGMDCSLISFNNDKTILTYAAANNPIWIVRTLIDSATNQLIELSPDKIPVGKHDRDSISFTQHEIELQRGDMIYTLTDGYPDQFGGPKGKKYMYKKLKELLISISILSLTEQKEILEKELQEWKGNTEQVDDITIIGVRV